VTAAPCPRCGGQAPNRLAISEIKFTRAAPHEIEAGLLGYVSCVIQDRIYLSGITLRRRSDGRLILSFPSKRDRRGFEHPFSRPVDHIARREIERAIFNAIAQELAP
jgi:hypothetical protein